jgi:hypothetical protein
MKRKLTKKDIKVISNKKPRKPKRITMENAEELAIAMKKDLDKILTLGTKVCSESKLTQGETATIVLNAISMTTGDFIIKLFKKDKDMVVKKYSEHIIEQVKKTCV